MTSLPYSVELVQGWRRLPRPERVERNVANLRRCVVPWEELLAEPVPPDDPKRFPLLFTHFKKTAGTTLQQVVARNYNVYRIVSINAPALYAHPGGLLKVADQQEGSRQARFFVVMGHHNYADVVYSLVEPRLVHFTLLRDPVARVLSHYRRIRSGPDHPLHALVRTQSLAEYLESNPARESRDAQAHGLAGLLAPRGSEPVVDGERILETAKRNLLQTTTLFGTTEHFDGFLLLCQRLLGWTDIVYAKRNVTPRDDALRIGPDEIELVRRRNPLDAELHAFATRLFLERLEAAGIDARALAAHRRAQVAFGALISAGCALPEPPPEPAAPDVADESGAGADPSPATDRWDGAGLVASWRSLKRRERVARNVANLTACIVPFEELAASPLPDSDRSRFPLVFTHLKKTGGTTLQQVIARNYPVSALLQINAPTLYEQPAGLFKLVDPADRRKQADFFAIMGHHRYSDVLYSLLRPRVVHLTLLRDPVDRVISHYRFARWNASHPLHALARRTGLREFVEADPALEACDAQARRLAGTQERRPSPDSDQGEVLAAAKRHLLQTVSLFGTTEEFDAFLLMCQRLLGWPDVLHPRLNVTPPAPDVEITAEDIELVRRLNPLDTELHAFATAVSRERWRRLGISPADLDAHRAANASFAALLAGGAGRRQDAGGRPAAPSAVVRRADVPIDPQAAARRRSPVVITGRFRSGTTLLWQIFERSPRHAAFYEPCHDNLLEQIGYGRASPSHRGVTSYWGAYLPVLDTVRALHRPEFGFDRLLLEATDDHEPLERYLAALIAAAGERRPVLKFNRLDFRLPWLRARFPEAVIVHVRRSARESWASMVRHLPPDQVDDPDHRDLYDLLPWCLALATHFPFLLAPEARSSYARHYHLWRLSGLMGSRLADLSLDFDDELQAEPERGLQRLAAVAQLDAHELATARALIERVPSGAWRRHHPLEDFAEIEARCERTLDALGLLERFGLEPLAAIRARHPQAWAAADESARGVDLLPLLAACSAWRGEVTRLLHAVREPDDGRSAPDSPATDSTRVG